MKDRFLKLVILGFTFVTSVHLSLSQSSFETNIIFRGYNDIGFKFNSTFSNNATLLQACSISKNITIITHGWGESISSVWTQSSIANFTSVKGGCVLFMDYGHYSQDSYGTLFGNFNSITQVLTKKLLQLDQLGYVPINFFLFGFSFGAHLVFEGAYKYGPRKVARVDCCDPAGPLFFPTSKSVEHAPVSAKFVQCIHTSNDKGTTGRYCQIDINMSKCGNSQPGSTKAPYLSHGLCPVMYVNAFNVNFNLVPVAKVNTEFKTKCSPKRNTPDVTQLPNCTMGYRFNTNFPLGEYYALTGANSPFNVK